MSPAQSAENCAHVGYEGDEMWLVIALQRGKLTTVEHDGKRRRVRGSANELYRALG